MIHVLTPDWEARQIMLCENELSESGAVLADIGKTENHANIICSIKPYSQVHYFDLKVIECEIQSLVDNNT